jgi:hypothetical protein
LNTDPAKIVVGGHTAVGNAKVLKKFDILAVSNIQKDELEKRFYEYAESIEQYFRENPPRNTNEARDAIEKLTGIKRSPTQVRKFMKKLGLRCLKVGFVPGKAATPEKILEQEDFKKEELEPHLAEAKDGKRTIFFY